MAVIAVLFLPPLLQHKQVKSLPYKTFLSDVSAHQVGFDHDTNAVTVFGADGTRQDVPLMSKLEVADAILDSVIVRLGGQRAGGGVRRAAASGGDHKPSSDS